MRLLVVILLLGALATARAGEYDLGSDVELTSRVFPHDAAWAGQDPRAVQASLAWTAELRWRNDRDDRRVSLIPFLRWDATAWPPR